MSTVTSFLTNLSIQGQKLAYVDTAPFSINGVTYRGLINTSQSGSDFIITQRYTSNLFHNIQVNETQFMVQVSTGDFLPSEIRNVIGKGQFFLTTTNSQTVWYFRTLATTGSQSNVDLTNSQSGFITNSSNLFLSIVNGRLTMSSNAGQFNTVKPSNSNLIIGATSLSGNSGGGSGGVTLTPSGALSSSYYIPFSSTISGVVTTMGTDVSGLIYDNFGHRLTVGSVVTNKIGIGIAPESTNLSIGNNALLNNNGANSNTAIGHESLFNNTIGYSNVAIGTNSLYGNIEGANNIAIGDECLYSNISGNNNIGMGSETLGANINGGNNIGVGVECLHANTEGSNNISLGYRSLFNNISGNNNIAVGFNALAPVNGDDNIGIGAGVGSNYTGIENGNILIGNAGIAGDNNIIRIGNNSSVAAFIEPVLLRRLTIVPYMSIGPITEFDLINSLISTTNDITLTLPTSAAVTTALGTTVFDNASFNFTIYSTNTTTLSAGLGDINIIGNPVVAPGNTRIFVMHYTSPTWNLY